MKQQRTEKKSVFIHVSFMYSMLLGQLVCLLHFFTLANLVLPVGSTPAQIDLKKNESNETSSGNIYVESMTFLILVIYTTMGICVCGIISNGFLLIVFATDPLRCLRNTSSGLILNLCVADLLTATMLFLWATTHWNWASEDFSEVVFGLVWFGYSASFLTIALLALERYIVIRYIWSADTIVTKRRTVFAVVIIWFISGISLFPRDHKNRSAYIFVLSSVFELSVLIVIIFYVKLWILRRRHSFQQHRALIKKENRLTKVVFTLIVLLVLTTVPLIFSYQLLHGWYLLCGLDCIDIAMAYNLPYLTPIFAVNFALNPGIYGWRLPKYRQSFFAMCAIIMCNPTRQKRDEIVIHKKEEKQYLEVNATQVTNGSCTSL